MNTSNLTLLNGSSITLVPVNQRNVEVLKSVIKNNIHLRSKSLLALSISNIILWTVSTFLQVATLVAFNGGLFNFPQYGMDFGAWGIWCSIFYAISGFTGYSASYNKKKSMIITSLVFAALSLVSSTIAAIFAGIQGGQTNSGYRCGYFDVNSGSYIYRWRECDVWGALEWTLMSVSIFAFAINLSVLVITSMAVCRCCRKRDLSSYGGPVAPGSNINMQYSMLTVPSSPIANQQPIFNPVTTQRQNYPNVNQQAFPLQAGLLQQSGAYLQLPQTHAFGTPGMIPVTLNTGKK